MLIIRYKHFFIGLSLALIVAAVIAMSAYGLTLGVDFKGGSLVEVEYSGIRSDTEAVKKSLEGLSLGQILVQPVGENGFLIRTRDISDAEHTKVLAALSENGTKQVVEKRFDSIGPVIGKELRNKAIWAIAVVILLIVLYITFAFRKVSAPVASWKYGVIAIITLLHDVIVPTGFYVIYGHFVGVEIDILFVTALLAILGFSIHDTIVVFDRIRENLRVRPGGETFETTVGKSLNQTFTRSINTSLTVILTLLALYFFGGESTRHFSLLLAVGIVAGTYSSVFFASPLLVLAEKLGRR